MWSSNIGITMGDHMQYRWKFLWEG